MKHLIPFMAAVAAGPVVADIDSTSLDPVVVTATRSDLELDRLPASAIVIERDAIERFPGASLADLLRYHAGLQLAQSGGAGANTSLFIRGTESNHVLMLIDGVEMNPGSIGGPALQHVPLESIERIEIIKGPRSALYGSEAIGGVINIITRRSEEDRWSLAATIGSFETRKLDTGYFGRAGNWHFGAELGRIETGGFPPRDESPIARGYERDQLNAYAGWRNDAFFLEARHWRAEGTGEYLGFFLEPLAQQYANETSALDVRYAGGDTWSTRLLLGNGQDAIEQLQPNFLGEFDFVETDRSTFDWQFDFHALESHLLTFGLYGEDTNVIARSSGSGYETTEDVKAVYAQDVATFGNASIVGAVRAADYETFGNVTTWNLGWNQDFGAGRFFVAAGNAFRAPDATDRFGFGGNPGLEPEKSHSLELGYAFEFASRHSLSIVAFRNDIDRLIAFVDPDGFSGPLPGGNLNIDEARIEGIEVVHERRGDNWHWRATAVLQDPRDLATGAQLARRSKRTFTASLVKTFDDIELGADLLAASRRPDSPFNSVELPGYAVLNATLRWFIAPGWSLGGRIENLLDREYQTAAGYNSAERSYYLTLRYSR